MAKNDRMIVPYVCEQCGASLAIEDKRLPKNSCAWCWTSWKMVKRYNGPEVSTLADVYYGDLSTVTVNTACYSFPAMAIDMERNWRVGRGY
ncbi:MAG: hypothetical protein ACYSTZ_01365 [Planctomycetota bacterium]|jgi:hypothetical protein